MPMIEANDGDTVAVKIKDTWIEKINTREGDKLVVKVKGETEEHCHATATLWMTDEIQRNKEESDITLNCRILEGYGMADGDIKNLDDIISEHATFYVSVKEKDGKTRTNFYLNKKSERIELEDAAEMIAQIRGKAKKIEEEVRGTPVESDDIAF